MYNVYFIYVNKNDYQKNIGPQNTAIIQSESSSLESQTILIFLYDFMVDKIRTVELIPLKMITFVHKCCEIHEMQT